MYSWNTRHGGDGSTVYCCPVCLRIELNSYEGWLYHLGTREHQMNNIKTREPFFNPRGRDRREILSRCVDVHDILGLKARQILDYFKTYGEITDFSYWYKNGGEDGMAVRCVVFYREKESAEACIGEKEHNLDGKNLRVQAFNGSSSGYGEGRGNRKRRGEDKGLSEGKRGKY